MLPGRGMNVLQITAYVPQKGEVPLLVSRSPEEAERLMNGIGPDAAGGESLEIGNAIEAPWAGRIFGTASSDGRGLTTTWRGHRLTLPVVGSGGMANGGLLLKKESTGATSNVMPDGGEVQASFHGGDFNGHWISQTDFITTLELSSRAIEMTVLAHNTGTEAEPIGIGWRPRFAIGDRSHVTLRLPLADRMEVADRRTGLPSGRLLPVTGTKYDFTAHDGVQLGSLSLDDSFVHLKPSFMDSGPVAELRDPASGYGLRLTLETSNVKALRVYAPTDANYISIDPQFNFDDPFGREWSREEDTGMVVLQPGQSVQWKVRLEIFSLTPTSSKLL
jgi:aldose 1-epimerase